LRKQEGKVASSPEGGGAQCAQEYFGRQEKKRERGTDASITIAEALPKKMRWPPSSQSRKTGGTIGGARKEKYPRVSTKKKKRTAKASGRKRWKRKSQEVYSMQREDLGGDPSSIERERGAKSAEKGEK